MVNKINRVFDTLIYNRTMLLSELYYYVLLSLMAHLYYPQQSVASALDIWFVHVHPILIE
jgi:hypothetical protein